MILSLDPGFDKLGYAVFDKKKDHSQASLVHSGLIKTKKSDPIEKRLLYIYEEISKLLKKFNPDKIVLEQLFLFKNQKTFIAVAQAQGVMMVIASQHHIPISFLTPLQIKQTITGYGNSDKKSVLKMLKLLLKTEIVVEDDDESDAIACGLAYCYLNRTMIG